VLFLVACQPYYHEQSKDFTMPFIAEAFPLADSIRNPNETRIKQILLGKALFFDPILSRDSSISCGSCHLPAFAFSDTLALSKGIGGAIGRRNTPALFNLSFHQFFFLDGGVHFFSSVAMAPLDSKIEMDFNIQALTYRLRASKYYTNQFMSVFGRIPDPSSILNALSSFQLSLISANSPYDSWLYLNDSLALSKPALLGKELFFSHRLACGECHAGPNFNDNLFHNIGLENKSNPDTGRARISMNWADYGKFKTPSLRNLSFTAPYMHDGRFGSLEQVIDYYNQGGDGFEGQDERIKALSLTETEKKALIAFLRSLNDSIFVNHPDYRP